MNNYSWLQKKIHKIALGSQFMREITFDVENILSSSIQKSDRHIFVCGLARSGTTILLNALYCSDKFASLSYADMPFVLAPNLWSKLSLFKTNLPLRERAHGDGIQVSFDSPEAFEEVFWNTFCDKEKDTKENFIYYINNITKKYKKTRYLSKNNQNIKRVDLILKIFPNAKILIPFRSPLQHSYSLLNQHKRFINEAKKDNFVSDYMYWVGHTEFGPNYKSIYTSDLTFKDPLDVNHWLEQWYLTYNSYAKLYQNHKNIKYICYEKLCNSKDYWHEVLKFSGIGTFYPFDFKEALKKIDEKFDLALLEKSQRLYRQITKMNS